MSLSLSLSLCRLSGVVYVADRETGFGLASQEPWIQHASVQENILFGKDYEPNFYQAVIEACALKEDLNVRRRLVLLMDSLLSLVHVQRTVD